MIRTISFLFILFASGISVIAQETSTLQKLKTELKSMECDPLFKYGQIGFSLRDPSGKIIYELNGDKSLIPASNLKLITTASALKILGENFQFQTRLSYDGILKNGVLEGNLYIEGGGDPTLGSDRIIGNLNMDDLFTLWTEKIKELGITKIQGSVIPIADIFDKNIIGDGWLWTDIGNYYGMGASGLNINENLYKLYFKQSKNPGDPVSIVRTEPSILELQFDNQIKCGASGSGDNAYIYGSPYSYYRYLSGSIPPGTSEFSIKGSMPDPPFLCAQLLTEYLIKAGMEVVNSPMKTSDRTPYAASTNRTLVYVHLSPELKEIIKYTNFYSINLYAEALLKMIAVKKGFSGDAKTGIRVLTDYWKSKGLDTAGMFLYDGSGLSPQTALRPSQMTQILYLCREDSVFFKSLPIAGESGTLSRFCKGTKAERKVYAKSGTLSKVSCYSGYVKSKKGQLNSFCIFINNYNGSGSIVMGKLEKVMILLTDI